MTLRNGRPFTGAWTQAILALATSLVMTGLARAIETTSPAQPTSVIELFTSQGCSSCPPADALMARLAKRPEILVLSMPIDYWDYIGWKDTLALSDFTARQKAYAAARGDGHVYTPQAIIDGLLHAVGSDATEIDDATRLAYGEKGALSVPLRVHREDGRLIAEVGGAPADAAKWGGFWVLRVARTRTVTIGRGENSGRTITYTNVVRAMQRIGDWTGVPAKYEIDPATLTSPDSDFYVLMLQASSGGKPGAILAAQKGDGL
jgi:hypothetical protein